MRLYSVMRDNNAVIPFQFKQERSPCFKPIVRGARCTLAKGGDAAPILEMSAPDAQAIIIQELCHGIQEILH
ncbi:MAG TPA: hypothetical protein DCP05_00935, partial [Rhodospirillaceae bacterium]|nr:hypothetical protein [Rhodospirillaceae bacterium]